MYKKLCQETSIRILQLGRITPGSDKTWMLMNDSMHLVSWFGRIIYGQVCGVALLF